MTKYEITFMTQSPRQMELEGPQTSINGLSYERVPGRGVHFKFGEMNVSPLGHMWFWKGENLQAATLCVYYSGKVPSLIYFFIGRSSYSDRHLFLVQLENTPEGLKSLDLAVPDKPSFKEIAIFGFSFERRGAGNKSGDFFIEKIECLDSSQQPAALSEKAARR